MIHGNSSQSSLPIIQWKPVSCLPFIDVWKNQEQAAWFGISFIPTQIFYDAKGKGVYRHAGFMSEEGIVAQLQEMGVK